MIATPLRLRDLVAAHLGFVLFRLAIDVRRLHAGARAVRRLRDLVGAGRSPSRSQVLVGMAFAV